MRNTDLHLKDPIFFHRDIALNTVWHGSLYLLSLKINGLDGNILQTKHGLKCAFVKVPIVVVPKMLTSSMQTQYDCAKVKTPYIGDGHPTF